MNLLEQLELPPPVILMTPCQGAQLPYGRAVISLVQWLRPHLSLRDLTDWDRLEGQSLVIVGEWEQLSPPLQEECLAAGFIPGTDAGGEEGIVFRAMTKSIPPRPLLLVTGTSADAILKASRWLVNPGLAWIAAAPSFPNNPIIATIPLAPDAVALSNGFYGFDASSREWKPRTRIDVYLGSDGKQAKRIVVTSLAGQHEYNLSHPDLPLKVRLLWLLVQKTRAGEQPTFEYLVSYLGCDRTQLHARLHDLKEMVEKSTGYKIRSVINVYEADK